MAYYDFCRLMGENGWVSHRIYNNTETWCNSKGDSTVITMQEFISLPLVESIIARS